MANDPESQPLRGETDDKATKHNRNRDVAMVIGALVLLAGIGVIIYFVARTDLDENKTESFRLRDSVTVNNIMKHLQNLQDIAYEHPNKSRSVLNNYNASAEYVIAQLEAHTDCQIERQHFVVPVGGENSAPKLKQLTPYSVQYTNKVDFGNFRYSNFGNITSASVVYVDNSGCSDTDYASFPAGAIALLMAPANSTACPIYERVFRAEDFKASAVMIFGRSLSSALSTERARYVDWKEGQRLVQVPVISVTNSLGNSIIQLIEAQQPVTFALEADNFVVEAVTSNVLCISKTGNENNTVVFGAHLDSVPEGPGINDDGSGSATMLETVIQIYKNEIKPANRFIFGWWGAEEIGLLGSRHFVRYLQANNWPVNFNEVVMNLNSDMLASPNFLPYIHSGITAPNEAVRDSSVRIQNLFEAYFNQSSLPFVLTSMVSGSDFLPFLEAGIPSGGVLTGAGGIKTADERHLYGGLANAAYDPCYHQSCDSVENISKEALRQNSEAAAQVIQQVIGTEDLQGFLSGTASIIAP